MTNTFKHDEMLDLHLFLTYIYLGFNINGQIGSKVVFVPHVYLNQSICNSREEVGSTDKEVCNNFLISE